MKRVLRGIQDLLYRVKKNMIYEWREYEVALGKMGALHERFQNVTLRLFEKHGINVIGFWETVIGTSGILYYMVAYEDLAHREKAWDAFIKDPEWIKAKRESEKDGRLVKTVKNMVLKPTSYSLLK